MSVFLAKKEITPDTVLQRKHDSLFKEVDNEIIMLSIENGEYYGMDKIGSRIWKLLEKPTCLNELVRILMSEYEVQEKQCIKDILIFLNKLIEKKLIVIK